MYRFKSLTAKLLLMGMTVLAAISIYIYAGYRFTSHIEGEATRINMAGQLRFHSFEMAWMIRKITEAPVTESRQPLIKELRTKMATFEKNISDLKDGNEDLNIKSLKNKDALELLNNFSERWNENLKPMLLEMEGLPNDKARLILHKYDPMIHSYVYEMVHRFVNILEEDYKREIKNFNTLRFYTIGFFFFIMFFIIFFSRETIVKPLRRLRDTAKKIGEGKFSVRVSVKTKDEVGKLGNTVNTMAQSLEGLFNEKERNLKELDILNKVAATASHSLTVDVVLNSVMDLILDVEPMVYKRRGVIFLADHEIKALRLAVARNLVGEQINICSKVLYGECLCGICAEEGKLILSESIFEDKRVTKAIPADDEHGHLVLPLESPEKILGVLCLDLQPGAKLDERKTTLYKSISNIISVSLLNAINHRQVAMLAQSIDSSLDFIAITDTEGTILHVNPRVMDYLGYAYSEIIGKNVSIMQSPNNPPGLSEEIFKKSLEGGWSGELINIRRDGSEYPVYLSTAPVRDRDGNIISLIGIARDITEKKEAEERQRRSEANLAKAQEIAHLGSREWDIEEDEYQCSDEYYRIFGTSRELCETYDSFLNSVNPADRELVEKVIHNALHNGVDYRIEYRIVLPDGKEQFIHEEAVVTHDESGRVIKITAAVQDITERKRLEDQLGHAQKMEAIGQLTAGIAHDFNNILNVIVGYGDILRTKLKADELLKDYAEQILASSELGSTLTQSLLAFSKKQIISPKLVDLNTIIKSIEKLLSRLINERIDLRFIFSDRTLTIFADSGQIEQILMNLVTNAKDAMPGGGMLTIKTIPAEIDSEFIKEYGYGKPGMYACVSVTDTGTGMDKRTKERIFEPFFTTKELGRGTGLGLATVYGIVKQHNGYINVDSEPNRGTTFKIYLPLAIGDTKEIEQIKDSSLEKGTETVLLAEDDEALRKLMKLVLEGSGYTVIVTVDGEDAIEKFRVNKDRVDILLLDVMMPKKNGREVYESAKEIRPDIKALFVSGYAANIIHERGILEKGLEFIFKPVLPRELLRKIREVLVQ